MRKDSGFTLSVLPTADMAPTAEVSVSGEIRTALLYSDFLDDDNADVAIRARLFVKGKADTAVGEVGGYFRFETRGGGDFTGYSENASIDKAHGWWKFAPNWELWPVMRTARPRCRQAGTGCRHDPADLRTILSL